MHTHSAAGACLRSSATEIPPYTWRCPHSQDTLIYTPCTKGTGPAPLSLLHFSIRHAPLRLATSPTKDVRGLACCAFLPALPCSSGTSFRHPSCGKRPSRRTATSPSPASH